MSSYVKLFISFPIFFVTFWRLAFQAILRTADWVRSEAGMSLKLGVAFSHGGYMGEMWAFMRKGMKIDQL